VLPTPAQHAQQQHAWKCQQAGSGYCQ
jgi:hypothetical protein